MAVPSIKQLEAIPLARCGEFELSDKEVRTTRTRLYSINKDHIRRYRTMRDGPFLVVWRIK